MPPDNIALSIKLLDPLNSSLFKVIPESIELPRCIFKNQIRTLKKSLPGVGRMAFEPPKSCQMIFPDSKIAELTKSSTDLTSKLVLSKSIFHAILPFLLPSEKKMKN